MDYLTLYYKNKSEQLQEQFRFLEKQLSILTEDLEVERGQFSLVNEKPPYAPEAIYWGGTGGIRIEKIDPKLLTVLGLGGVGALEKFIGEPQDRERTFKRLTPSADGKVRIVEPAQTPTLRISGTEAEPARPPQRDPYVLYPERTTKTDAKTPEQIKPDTSASQAFSRAKTVKDIGVKGLKGLGKFGYTIATDYPGFVGGEMAGEALGELGGVSTKEEIPDNWFAPYIDTSERGVSLKWPISTYIGAATGPYVRSLLRYGAGRILPNVARIGAGEALAGAGAEALGAVTSPWTAAIALTPLAAEILAKGGEKAIKSYYDVSDEDYEKLIAQQEKEEEERLAKEQASAIYPQRTDDDSVEAQEKRKLLNIRIQDEISKIRSEQQGTK